MYLYRAYGLTLGSNRVVPGMLAEAAGPADVLLDFQHHWPHAGDAPARDSAGWVRRAWPETKHSEYFGWWTLATPAGEYHRLAYGPSERRIEYLLNPGATQITIIYDQAEWSDGVGSLLLGQVMGCALRLRGLTCLHASVVAIGDRAVAVVGHAKAGKSTFAAAAAAKAGLAVLSDDLAVLAESERGPFLVQPGYPHLRLSPPAIAAFYGEADGLRPVFSFLSKRYVELTPDAAAPSWRFQAAPLPLAAVYILAPREPAATGAVAIRPLPPTAGLLALKDHAYVRFFLTPAMKTHEFARLGRLARETPVRMVDRPEGLAHLPALCDAIMQDAAGLATEVRIS